MVGDKANNYGRAGCHAHRALVMALMATAGPVAMVMGAAPAFAQSGTRSFDIPAQPLATALTAFGRQSGLQVSAQAPLIAGKTSTAVRGDMPPLTALGQILGGSGLAFRIEGGTVTLERAPQADSGAIQLGTLRVEGASQGRAGGFGPRGGIGGDGVPASDTPYVGAGSRAHISAEQVERFRGTSIGDVLSGQPGILVGNSRNTGGVDVNIRGMQGQGRVPVVIDGATQDHTSYRGYNGAAGRSYLDPDFIGSIDIEKGPSSGPDATGATGGVVRVTTIKPADILQPGEKWGFRVKVGFNGNSAPVGPVGTISPLAYDAPTSVSVATAPDINSYWTNAEPRNKRPSLLTPTGESVSLVGAYETDIFDVVVGYARRNNGNYFAGKGNDAAHPVYITGSTSAINPTYRIINGGLSRYANGEEILNTSLDNESALIKATFRFSDHALELGYTKYKSAFGQVMPTQIWGQNYQSALDTVNLDTYTARYKFDPLSDLIELKADAYLTDMDSRINAAYLTDSVYDTYYYNRLRRYGLTVSNRSVMDTGLGEVALQLGGSIIYEKSGLPMSLESFYKNYGYFGAVAGSAREGWRRELSGFATIDWQPVEWMTIGASLRYNGYKSYDKNPSLVRNPGTDIPLTQTQFILTYGDPIRHSAGGWSPNIKLLLEPLDGIQLYGKYAHAQRMPSIFENLSGFSSGGVAANSDLRPEHMRSWELGANFLKDDVFLSGDKLRFHAAWFDNYVNDFITRANVGREIRPGVITYLFFQMINLDYAKMRGFEISGEYDAGIAYAKASWNHYVKSEYCGPGEGVFAPTDAVCAEGGVRNSYVLHQLPPKDSITAELGVRLFDKRLNLGGRMTYIGKRPVEGISEEDTTDWDNYTIGIRPSKWNPYTLLDVYASYKVSNRFRLDAAIDNITDHHYMDALGDSLMPAPGRTFRLTLTGNVGPGGADEKKANDLQAHQPVNWTGLHGGIGVAIRRARIKGETTDGSGLSGGIPATESARQKINDRNAYVHAGYDYQLPGNVVIGVEADYAWGAMTGMTDTEVTTPASLVGATNSQSNSPNLQARTYYELKDHASLRARLGYATGRTLFYGTGGLAVIREREERTQYVSLGVSSTNLDGRYTAVMGDAEADRKTRTGWAMGGGLEYQVAAGWSLRADYLYTRFGREEFSFPDARLGVGGSGSWREWVTDPVTGQTSRVTITHVGDSETVNGRRASNRAEIHALRIGISHRF